MSVYVLDSNIVSYYLKENEQVIRSIENALIEGHEILIAPIAYYEVRRGLIMLGSDKRMQKFEKLCQMFTVGQLDNLILNTAADIYAEQRRKGFTPEDADILIAAFCRYHGFELVTNNVKHFENISGLRIVNWAVTF